MLAPSTPQSLEALFQREGDHVSFSPGQQLLEQGEIGPGVWWITKGCIRSLAALPPHNDWRTVQRHGPGELVGWLGLIHARPMEWLRASEASTAWFLDAARFRELWRAHADLREWCSEQTPNLELIQLLLQLAHGDPAAPVNSINGASSVMSSSRWIRTPIQARTVVLAGWKLGPIGQTLNRFNNG